MLDTLITSKTRIKLLLKFFLNSNSIAWLRGLETELGESSNAIRIELNRFEEAGLLTSEHQGNRKVFRANTKHPLFGDINSILLKFTGIDQVIERVLQQLGNLQKAYITGDLAAGRDSMLIDLVLVGYNIDRNFLLQLIDKAEKFIQRKIRYCILEPEETHTYLEQFPEALLLWEEN
ncbi:MAG: ArsR family transcriptional regulator [Bacteroidales bacterium]|jgi:DNA-binding transcriptional ArsR family regulator|nr:ArsR family transcriptional regulator [Bacteroidales bacterium]